MNNENIPMIFEEMLKSSIGFTIFGILGHLAHELGTDDISSVVNGGSGLAFISYPEAIARFDFAPQVCNLAKTITFRQSISLIDLLILIRCVD